MYYLFISLLCLVLLFFIRITNNLPTLKFVIA